MNKYLARLKSEKQPPSVPPKLPKPQNSLKQLLPKLPKPPFDSKGSTEGGHISEKKLQTLSRDWRQFCDSHERSLPGGMCPLKRERGPDPFTGCLGWQLKTGGSSSKEV